MDGWGITNTLDGYVIEAGNTIAVKARDNIVDSSEPIYWVAPDEYLENKVGGKRSLANHCGKSDGVNGTH